MLFAKPLSYSSGVVLFGDRSIRYISAFFSNGNLVHAYRALLSEYLEYKC